jgi:hypothetical protein
MYCSDHCMQLHVDHHALVCAKLQDAKEVRGAAAASIKGYEHAACWTTEVFSLGVRQRSVDLHRRGQDWNCTLLCRACAPGKNPQGRGGEK